MIVTNTDLHSPEYENHFGVVYADPPWGFNDKKTGGSFKSAAGQKYDTQKAAEIADDTARMIRNCTDDNALLFMWYVSSQPKEAIALAESWGFEVRHMNVIVWDKLSKNSNARAFMMGHYTRGCAESILLGVRGRGTRQINAKNVRQVQTPSGLHDVGSLLEHCGEFLETFFAGTMLSFPVREHSRKPDQIRDILEYLTVGPRLEMYGRQTNPGWCVFGNEATKFDNDDSKIDQYTKEKTDV